MARRKATPFARLLLFLIIFLPLAYLGAAYLNGEDGIANIRRLISGTPEPTEQVVADEASMPADGDTAQRIADLEAEVARLQRELREKEAYIDQLESQIGQ